MIVFATILIYGCTAKVEAKSGLAQAHCFCKASWDLGGSLSSINPAFVDWGQIKTYSGLNPQKEANQDDCREVCEKQAASDPRFTQEWWCANVIGEEKKPYSGKMIAYSAVGTKDYRKALERDITCPKSSTQTVGFLAPDNRLRDRCLKYGIPQVETKTSSPVLSPRITNVISAKNWSVVGYDSSIADRFFIDSFRLGNCKVCYAEMTVQVRAIAGVTSDGDAGNDALNILGGPDDNKSPNYGISPLLQAFRIWQTPTPPPNMPAAIKGTSKTITFQIPANLLTDYIYKSNPNTPLDVLVQDDTQVRSMQISVWYY